MDIWNLLEVLPAPSDNSDIPLVQITGEGSGELAGDQDNLVYRSMAFLYRAAGKEIPVFRLRCRNDIPLERGLGSSAAAIAGGLVAANALCGDPFATSELLEMAATIEGHPDNVAAAILGGLQLVVMDQQQLHTVAVSVPPESESSSQSAVLAALHSISRSLVL